MNQTKSPIGLFVAGGGFLLLFLGILDLNFEEFPFILGAFGILVAFLGLAVFLAVSAGRLKVNISGLDPKLVGAIVAGAGFVIWILAVLVNDFPFSNQFWFYVRWVGGLFIGAGLTMFLAQLGALPSGTIGPLEFGSSGGGATPPPPGGGTPPPPPPPG